MKYKTVDEVLSVASFAEGKRFSDYDIHHRLDSPKNKGALGQIVEEGVFGYEINNRSEADFANLGVELKVVPVKKSAKNKLTAKERIVLTIIDYMEEYKKTFYESDCWKKSEKLLLMFYLWEKELSKGQYRILKTALHQFSEKDLLIIKRDWQIIIDKIKAGKAEEISESDTMYLAACTKGANSSSVREQPFSTVKAKQRAYSLKSSYVTRYVQSIMTPAEVVSISSDEELQHLSIEEILEKRFAPYRGLTLDEIGKKLSVEINSKNKAEVARLTSLILGIRGTKLKDIDEFAKANIVFKTIRLEPNGMPKESMSFEQIDFNRLLNTEWEDSQFYEKFEYTKFLFVVFEYKESERKNPNRKLYFKTIKLWNMPEKVIETELKKLWETTRKVVQEGVIFHKTKRGIANNLPGMKDSEVCHIRPKGNNGKDMVILPTGQKIAKQTYWLNRKYVASIVQSEK